MRYFILPAVLLVTGCSAPQQQAQAAPSAVEPTPIPATSPSPSITGTESVEPTTATVSDAPVTSEKWPTAYKRRCYQLGITMSQFKTIRHPDQKEWPNAYPAFSNEARVRNDIWLSDAKLYGSWETAGVIKSHYFWVYRNDSHPSGAGLMLGRIGSLTNFYFYPESEGKEPVLFYIESGGPSEDFGYVADLYREAMGEPTRVHSEQVQNKLGATFTNEIIEYTNDVSAIRLGRFGETLRVFKVEYILVPVMARLHQQLEPLRQDEARKL